MKKSYVAVVGGTNIDIGGFSSKPIVPSDSNPGTVRMCPGGVGHNIADNLARLGVPVVMLTAFGDDYFGELLQSGESCNLDLSKAIIARNSNSGIYLYVSDCKGDMQVAINDMSIMEAISEDYIMNNLDVLNNSEFVIIEANLPKTAIDLVSKVCTKPIIADTVSTIKAPKLNDAMRALKLLKPNMLELGFLSGTAVRDEASFRKACRALLEKGPESLLVSAGSAGAVFCTKDKMIHCPVLAGTDVKNTTGAGDSLMAGFAYGMFRKLDSEGCLKHAMAAAQINTMSCNTVSENMSGELISSIAGEIEIDEELSGLFR